MNTRIQITIQR